MAGQTVRKDRRAVLKACGLYRLCHLVETTRGGTVTVRPGMHLGLRGHRAARALEVLTSMGCVKIGRAYSKVYCPKSELEKLCRLFRALLGI
jgi:hypothetical protein